MQFWTFLHILAMFGAVTVVVGSQLWAAYAIRSRDVGSLRAYFRISDRIDMVGGILLLVGIVLGAIAAVVIGFDLLQTWLVVAYVLILLSLVVGFASVPYLRKLKSVLEANEGDDPGAELDTLLASPIVPIVTTLSVIIISAIVLDMVFKPAL